LAATFPVQGGLKQGDALLPLLFSLALGYAIRNVQVNLEGLEFCGTHQLCPCAGNFNLLGRNQDTVVPQSSGLCGRRGGLDYLEMWTTKGKVLGTGHSLLK